MQLKQLMGGLVLLTTTAFAADDAALKAAIASPLRDPANTPRDVYRHPYETLTFFGVRPDMTVVEVWPGGGWYVEILAPYLRDKGKYYAAHFPADSTGYFGRNYAAWTQKVAARQDIYGKAIQTAFMPPKAVDIAPRNSADMVLTFRNVHNWYMNGGEEANVKAAFKAFYDALKPGGVLGVVEHRLPANRPQSDTEKSGYTHEAFVIKVAQSVGFKLAAKSEINANPKDTADHPEGVWTLPPTLALKDKDREKYLAIGESDRMTLKFVK